MCNRILSKFFPEISSTRTLFVCAFCLQTLCSLEYCFICSDLLIYRLTVISGHIACEPGEKRNNIKSPCAFDTHHAPWNQIRKNTTDTARTGWFILLLYNFIWPVFFDVRSLIESIRFKVDESIVSSKCIEDPSYYT